jgi:3D (Asp-Asp-Asp) domain-containing protein
VRRILIILACFLISLLAGVVFYKIASAEGPFLSPPPVVTTVERPALPVEGPADRVSLGTWLLTHYSCSIEEGTQDCHSSSGMTLGPGSVAHVSLPFGTRLWVDGYGEVVVADRGALVEGQLDVWMGSHAEADELGVKYLEVWEVLP